jgi:hypothetical protein
MSFKYACFVSYCHGSKDLINSFVPQFVEALKDELEAYLDSDVYMDSERLKPGYRFNEKLAEAICQSVCMIVVYYPRYDEHIYCLREYTAMEILEGKRLSASSANGEGLIIPIILRGDFEELPAKIKDRIHYADFRSYTTASKEIKKDKRFVPKIQEIAKYINKQYERLKDSVCDDCETFKIPEEGKVTWKLPATFSTPGFRD